ncbi:hypothetical protein E6B08_03870 [Pseudomonas putida]|uniref:Lipoprotein n=1 Tax=Pseudomonas putida TaxID=303 RepID=A0A4D6X3T7_PSEPU|nr:hypothetical protein [Pseudomonas putida]QCI10599.1 hypothetical protein E6B08_03870 [Pseudomonas putida]
MLRIVPMIATAFTLSACSGNVYQYESPEARQQMSQDLILGTIIDSSRMNWCVHPYGSAPGCKPEKGIGIVTPDGLVMAHFVNGKYVQARVLKSEDVICSTVPGGRAADGFFFAFTDSKAYMLGPLQADRDEINARFKAHMFDYLHSNGQHSFDGPEINFQRPSGIKRRQTVVAPSGPSTLILNDMVDVLEVYSPCSHMK